MLPHSDHFGEVATMNDAHREWHRNTGVPMGQPGCPQDACDPYHGDDYDNTDAQDERERTAVPALPEPQTVLHIDPPF